MGKFFEESYGSRRAVRKNAWTVVAASLAAYALSVVLTFRNRRLGSSK